MQAEIRIRVDEVKTALAEAAARAGRSPDVIRLVAVTKTHDSETVLAAIRAGLCDIGENRVQEACSKFAEIKDVALPSYRCHMVGHLQTNKVRQCLTWCDMIQSLDRVRLARRIDAVAAERGRPCSVLIQVNVGSEEQKSGVVAAELPRLVSQVLDLPGLRLQGLMAVPPFRADPEQNRPHFARMRELAEVVARESGLSKVWLSMGMSNDYKVAVEEGSDMVRLGAVLFGPRSGR